VVYSKSRTPPLRWFGKREEEFLLELELPPLGLEGREEFE
jgi:hypothetical protein